MDLNKEFDEITDVLKQQRGEIQLQIHLANLDAKQEWQRAEKKWGKFVESLGVITDESKVANAELIHATRRIGDELKVKYKGIFERLGKE